MTLVPFLISSHIYVFCKAKEGCILSDVIRDFKKFTSKKVIQTGINETESKKRLMLDYFSIALVHLKREL